ncbi:MAG: SDR family oxidoreductase [Betaproteobacteria bacterium]
MPAAIPAVPSFDLSGKVAFVPGGYGAIGAAIARGLAHHGAEVVVAGRDPDKATAFAAELAENGSVAAGIGMDAHSVASIRSAVDSVAARRGHIDILVNCVGIQREEALLDVTEEAYDEVYEVNLKAAMFVGQAVARHQVAAGCGGRHVHLLSVRAHFGLRDRGYSAYCSTKGGLVMLIKQHAVELARHGITVNGVAPTVVRSAMANHWLDNPVTAKQIVERIPLGRVAEPEDAVGPALLFCSPAGEFLTGQILYVDGGITASQ